ncbi:MAG: hypothetical protein ACFCVK_23900 [Acidimicrobiales bacterium]
MAAATAERDEVLADLATVHRGDVEVILHRAIRLADDDSALGVHRHTHMPVAGIEQVAAELHVPVGAVADALAEYRAGALPRSAGSETMLRMATPSAHRRGVLDRLVGPRSVQVLHRTGLSDEEATAGLGDWLRRRHRLEVRVDAQGTVVGVRRRGMLSGVARQVRSAAGRSGLSGVKEVRGAAVSADAGLTSICVVVDVSGQRAQSIATGTAVAMGGSAVVSLAALLTAPVTFVGVPVAVGAGWATSRVIHRYRVQRISQEVEITADQVAAGAAPPTLVRELGGRILGAAGAVSSSSRRR